MLGIVTTYHHIIQLSRPILVIYKDYPSSPP